MKPEHTMLEPCGTYAAAMRHYYYGEQPCDDCHKAALEYWREWREDLRANRHRDQAGRLVLTETPRTGKQFERHGTWYGYCYGCRCDKCYAAYEAYQKSEERAATRRRSQANRRHNARILAEILAKKRNTKPDNGLPQQGELF